MKSLRGTLIILAIFGAVTLLYGLSFANEEHAQADIKLLKESAVALQRLRPDLAQGLRNYADKEAKDLEEATSQKSEKEEIGEKVESKEEETEVVNPERKEGEVLGNVEQREQENKLTY